MIMSRVTKVMDKDSYMLEKVTSEGELITRIATELAYLRKLEDSKLIVDGSQFDIGYEGRQLRTIKNAITNIYLMLELNEVKGICDDIYDSKFKMK